jgi:hypothetical protein
MDFANMTDLWKTPTITYPAIPRMLKLSKDDALNLNEVTHISCGDVSVTFWMRGQKEPYNVPSTRPRVLFNRVLRHYDTTDVNQHSPKIDSIDYYGSDK